MSLTVGAPVMNTFWQRPGCRNIDRYIYKTKIKIEEKKLIKINDAVHSNEDVGTAKRYIVFFPSEYFKVK